MLPVRRLPVRPDDLTYIVDAEGSGQDGAWEVKCREGIPAEQEAVRGACIIIVDLER